MRSRTTRRTLPLSALAVAISLAAACGASDRAESPQPTYDPDAPKSFVKADTDLTNKKCSRGREGFSADVTVTNNDDYDATYIVTARIDGPEGAGTGETTDSDPLRIAAGATAPIEISPFGAESPEGATCTLSARKQKVTE